MAWLFQSFLFRFIPEFGRFEEGFALRGIEDIVLCAHFFGEGTFIVDVLLYQMKNVLPTIKLEKCEKSEKYAKKCVRLRQNKPIFCVLCAKKYAGMKNVGFHTPFFNITI